MDKMVSFHIDLDSPLRGFEFWGITNVEFTTSDLERFYEIAIDRCLRLFGQYNIMATFFCVGEELEKSNKIRALIAKAFSQGHEIANHTYSHPVGLSRLNKSIIRKEIETCSKIICEIIGVEPVGFRAPGYDMNTNLLNDLENLSFQYDSSGFWTILNPLFKIYHRLFSKEKKSYSGYGENSSRIPHSPYFPSKENWLEKGNLRSIIEIPLPRTKILNLPFYNNFHLITNRAYRRLALKNFNRSYFVYLFHLLEFVDFSEGIPEQLLMHPNLKIKATNKINIMQEIIEYILKRYKIIRTDEFVKKVKCNPSSYLTSA